MKEKKQKQYILLKRTKTIRAGAVTPAESEDINMIKLADMIDLLTLDDSIMITNDCNILYHGTVGECNIALLLNAYVIGMSYLTMLETYTFNIIYKEV